MLTSILKKIADASSIIPLGIMEKRPKKRKNLLKSLRPTTSRFYILNN